MIEQQTASGHDDGTALSGPVVLLVSPSDELAVQIEQGLQGFSGVAGLKHFTEAMAALRHYEANGPDMAGRPPICLFDDDTPDLTLPAFAENLRALPGGSGTALLALVDSDAVDKVQPELVTDVLTTPPGMAELHMRLQAAMRLQRLGRTRSVLARRVDLIRTEQRIASARLKYRASHDELTGLFNRHFLEQRLAEVCTSEDRTAALLYIDIGRFKVVNTYEGYQAGDRLLNRIARTIRGEAGDEDIVARPGSDEFAVLLYGCSEDDAIEVGERLRRMLTEARFRDSAHVYPLTASIGIAMLPDGEMTATQALTRAYQACFVAKSDQGNRVHVYNERDGALVNERRALHWVPMIRDALSQSRFRLVFQPVLDIHDHSIRQYEVLLRMLAEDGSLMPPAEFITVAEQTGLIHDIDRWVVSEALHVLAGSQERITLNVNLSGRAFDDATLVPFIRKGLEKAGSDPNRITFEITETAAIGNLERTREMVQQLRELGCRFALDDFGSGFNSYAHLKQFPVDTVKIDGSFITNLTTDHIDQNLVRSMADIARRLGKKTVAEFVENAETLAMLADLGVDYAQGFFIGRPDPTVPTIRSWSANDDKAENRGSPVDQPA
ncbi:EAL domain-containing protein [Wenzhouxiangella sp. AB-CW3]|uniref:putative bifunctional diguanylate cyclase/phosphodiesterase n=1 Tax=Wenzhouxiangella sp. AB-CW3 TaxID=2771012 RepID=UPI00168B4839|nr:EAL domain-containing protein [Wenzhouxiangella sp. AB-CW3]QOC21178.1 EAL domain-containing protein [Wenzhouxiangella sp. AB-CW3]